MTFLEKLAASIQSKNSLLSIGLDPDFERLPESLRTEHNPLFVFNKEIIEHTCDLAAVYKLQIASYAALGIQGIELLEKTVNYLVHNYPEVPLILDAKRADIADTSENYAREAFDVFEADAITVNPYLGKDALLPFLKRRDKGVIVLCRTSNPGAKDFQELMVGDTPLYLKVAASVNEWDKEFGNCLLVVGATWPTELQKIRSICPELFFLVPGIGAQGGDLEAVLKNGLRNDKSGLLIHATRSIIYAGNGADFAETARVEANKLKEEINKFR